MANGRRSVNDIFTRVQRTFGDEANIQVTIEDVIRWINDAQLEVVMQHENLLRTTDYLGTTAGRQQYQLPDNCYTINSIFYRDSEDENAVAMYPLQYKTPHDMDQEFPGWRASLTDAETAFGRGTPAYFSRLSSSPSGAAEYLNIFPVPEHTFSNNLVIDYNRYAEDVEDANSAIDLPIYYHGYVEHFCMMKAYEKDEDWGAVDRKAQLVQSTLDFNNAKEQWFGQETYPVISSEFD